MIPNSAHSATSVALQVVVLVFLSTYMKRFAKTTTPIEIPIIPLTKFAIVNLTLRQKQLRCLSLIYLFTK